ncbi:Com family DNA-binding transcriptional regulator [Pseudomonas syringae]
MHMLKDFRCGQCKKLLARMGDYTELQIKCSRCGTLNHVKATSHESSPLSERGTVASLLPPSAI